MARTSDEDEKMNSYYVMLCRFAFMQIRDMEEAQDIAQEALCRFLAANANAEDERRERAWLFKVASNLCKDYWRSPWHRKTVPLPSELPIDEDMEENALQKENDEKILMAVLKLPFKYRQVIHPFYYEDMSAEEISGVTGINLSTVYTRLSRGRDLLKKALPKEMGK